MGIGIRRLIRRSDGGRRYEVHHRRARFQFPADKVRISRSTLYNVVQKCGVPCQQIRRRGRFRKQAFDHWLVCGGADGTNAEGKDT